MVKDCTHIAVDDGATSSECTNEHPLSGIVKPACSDTATVNSMGETAPIHASPVNLTMLGVNTRKWNLAPWVFHALSNLSALSSDQSSIMIVLRVHGKKAADSICSKQIERIGCISYGQLVAQVESELPCPSRPWDCATADMG